MRRKSYSGTVGQTERPRCGSGSEIFEDEMDLESFPEDCRDRRGRRCCSSVADAVISARFLLNHYRTKTVTKTKTHGKPCQTYTPAAAPASAPAFAPSYAPVTRRRCAELRAGLCAELRTGLHPELRGTTYTASYAPAYVPAPQPAPSAAPPAAQPTPAAAPPATPQTSPQGR